MPRERELRVLQPRELQQELLRRKETNWKAEDLLTGVLHNRLGRVLTQSVGISGYVPIRQLEEYVTDVALRLHSCWARMRFR